MRRSLDCLKSLLDNMLSCLRQYLYRHIIRNHILLDESSHEVVLCLRCCRETYFNFLESDIYQHLEELQLLIQAHGLDQSLIAIS